MSDAELEAKIAEIERRIGQAAAEAVAHIGDLYRASVINELTERYSEVVLAQALADGRSLHMGSVREIFETASLMASEAIRRRNEGSVARA